MTEQTEAQRLAELLETDGWPDAADELRRLDEELRCEERRFEEMSEDYAAAAKRIAALDQDKAELLEALKIAAGRLQLAYDMGKSNFGFYAADARAAIAADDLGIKEES